MTVRPRVPPSRFELAALTLLVLLGVAFRLPLAREPLWVDELHTGWVVTHGLHALPEHARAGNQSPLWFYLPWLTTRFGENALLLRLPSLVAGVGLIPLLYHVARRITGCSTAALLAAALAALDPKFAFYATEARAYAGVQFFAVVHLAAWLALEYESPSGLRRVIWIATGILLFYFHYTVALVLVAEGLVDLVAGWHRRDGSRLARRAIDYALVATTCLPASAHLRNIAGHRDDWSQVLSADSPWLVFPWYVMALAPIAVFAASVCLRWKLGHQPVYWRPRAAMLFGIGGWILVPWIVAIAATQSDAAQLLRYRYLIASATALPLVSALALAALPHRLGRATLAVTVIALSVSEHASLRDWIRSGQWPAERTENWEAAVEQLNAQPFDEPRPILLCPSLVEDRHLVATDPAVEPAEPLVDFCRFPLRSLYRLSNPDVPIRPLPTLDSPRLSRETQSQIMAAGGGRLVVRGDEELARYVTQQLAQELQVQGITLRANRPKAFGSVMIVDLTTREQRAASRGPRTEGTWVGRLVRAPGSEPQRSRPGK